MGTGGGGGPGGGVSAALGGSWLGCFAVAGDAGSVRWWMGWGRQFVIYGDGMSERAWLASRKRLFANVGCAVLMVTYSTGPVGTVRMGGGTRGALIVIEGLDRAGKSTQCERLASKLEGQGRRVKRMRFPGTLRA